MNIEKRERKAKNERKSNNSNTIFFYIFLHFFIQKNLYFARNHIWKNLVDIVTIVLQFYRVANAIIKQ